MSKQKAAPRRGSTAATTEATTATKTKTGKKNTGSTGAMGLKKQTARA
jgi:hypothetical protein